MSVEPWLLDRLPHSGRLALDVGANVGSYTTWLAERFQAVHAFEPHPDAARVLRRRCESLGGVAIFEAAVGTRGGTLTLNTFGQTVHTSAFDDARLDTASRGAAAGQISVSLVSLDQLGYDAQPVDFVKIDTEGYEFKVLHGAERTLRACLPALLIEIHSEANGERCLGLLTGLGYTPERIPHPHSGVSAGHHWLAAATPVS